MMRKALQLVVFSSAGGIVSTKACGFCFILCSVLFCAPRADAQFLGYISPQTVSSKLLNAQTTPTTAVIPNLGQSIHAVTYTVSSPCTNGMSLDLRIEASNDGVNYFSVSEDALDQNSGLIQGATQGGLTAIGYYPAMRLNLARFSCPSGQTPTITAFYSGTSTSTPTATGTFYQSTPLRKVILLNQPTTNASTQPTVTVNAPNGMTAGQLWIVCSNAATGAQVNCPANMNVQINGYLTFVGAIGSTGTIFTLGTNVNAETDSPTTFFAVPNAPAISMLFSFTGSGAGSAGVNWSVFYLSNAAPTPNTLPDPCGSAGNLKTTQFRNITTATNTVIATTSTPGIQTIFVCSLLVNMVATGATTDTVRFFGSSGFNSCATPTGDLTATFSSGTLSAGATNISLGSGGATLFVYGGVQGGNSICVASTVGTTPTIGVEITYVIQ